MSDAGVARPGSPRDEKTGVRLRVFLGPALGALHLAASSIEATNPDLIADRRHEGFDDVNDVCVCVCQPLFQRVRPSFERGV